MMNDTLKYSFIVAQIILIIACLLLLIPKDDEISNTVGTFDLPVEETYKLLQNRDFKELRNARQCGVLIHFRSTHSDTDHLEWTVVSNNIEVFSFKAILIPVSENQTKIDLEISKNDAGNEAYDGSQDRPFPAFVQPARPAIAEQIAAYVDRRAFDKEILPDSQYNNDLCYQQRSILTMGYAPFIYKGESRADYTAEDFASYHQ